MTQNLEQVSILESRQEDLTNKIHELSREIELSYIAKHQQKKDELERLKFELGTLQEWIKEGPSSLAIIVRWLYLGTSIGVFSAIPEIIKGVKESKNDIKEIERRIIAHSALIDHLEAANRPAE